MTEASHIFLSYRSIEADFALKLAADLKNAGVRLWIDRLDGIQVGMDWPDAIQKALNTCAALIAVLSPDYVERDYCRNELSRAKRLNRPIFPVLLRPIKDEDWPIEIERKQYADFTNGFNEHEYRQQLDRLVRRLKEEKPEQISVVPDAETRYLTTLISELEAARGVLQYVVLAGQMDRPQEVRPKPTQEDECGFAELVKSHPSPDNLDQGEGFDSRERPEQRIPLENIAETVSKHPRFVLIGDPGAGKTTTIRKLALDVARARLDNPRTAPIPLLLYLSKWDQEPTLADFVRSRWESWKLGGEVTGMLRRGDVLLYLDGLNEMGANGPDRAKQISAWFAHPDNAPAHAIVTCRAGDYVGSLRLDETPIVLAQDLDKGQIRQFAANYLKEKADAFLARVLPEKSEDYESEWERQRREARSLFRLSRNPYMLSALLFVHEQGGDLPRNTGALFYRLIRALWAREKRRGTTGGIPFEQAERAFVQLAFAMIDSDRPLDVPVDWALAQMGANAVDLLRIGTSANYVLVSGGQVRFYHQLMQETFAALELEQVGVAGRISPPEFNWEGYCAQKWGQVAIALCGIGDAEAISSTVLEIDPFLAGECVASGVKVGAIGNVIISRLEEMLYHVDHNVRDAAAVVLVRIGNSAVEPLIATLHNTDGSLRQLSAAALGLIGDSHAVDPLSAALHDVDHNVREAAAYALGQIGDARAIDPLSAALRDANANVRWTAANALEKLNWTLGNDEISAYYWIARKDWKPCIQLGSIAVDPLIAALHDAHSDVQQAATKALGQIGDARAVGPLIAALRNLDDDGWFDAVGALGKIGDTRAVEPLIVALSNERYGRRGAIAIALGRIGDPRAVKPLIAILQDVDSFVEGAAAGALGQIGDPRAVEPLIAALHDSSPILREAAAKALGQISDARIVELVIPVLSAEDWWVREAAIQALGWIGGTRAVDLLIASLGDEQTQEQIAEALGRIGDPRAVAPLIDALHSESRGVQKSVVEALGDLGDPRGVEPLVIVLHDADPEVQWAAAGALGQIGDVRAVEPLIAVLHEINGIPLPESDSYARGAAAEALGQIGDSRAIEPLIVALLDTKSSVRQAAAGALEQLGWTPGNDETGVRYWIAQKAWEQCFRLGSVAVEPLIASLRYKRWEVRQAAAATLGQIGDPRAVEPLIAALRDKSLEVRQAAIEALEKIGTPEAHTAVAAWRRE